MSELFIGFVCGAAACVGGLFLLSLVVGAATGPDDELREAVKTVVGHDLVVTDDEDWDIHSVAFEGCDSPDCCTHGCDVVEAKYAVLDDVGNLSLYADFDKAFADWSDHDCPPPDDESDGPDGPSLSMCSA